MRGKRQFIIRVESRRANPDGGVGITVSSAKVVDTVMMLQTDYGWFWATIAEMTREMHDAGCRVAELKWDAEPWGDWT